jgi:hypothetical protein
MHRQFADELANWLKDGRSFFDYLRDNRPVIADPSMTGVMFTRSGILQVQDLDIDLAPDLKELIRPRKRRAGTNPTC